MTPRTYASPEAFKQALAQRLRTDAESGAAFARKSGAGRRIEWRHDVFHRAMVLLHECADLIKLNTKELLAEVYAVEAFRVERAVQGVLQRGRIIR